MKKLITLLFSLSLLPCLAQQTFYVSTDGNDDNPGTIDAPFATLGKAHQMVKSLRGDTVYIRGGVYKITDAQMSDKSTLRYYGIFFNLNKAGLGSIRRTCYFGYPGERPIFDFSEVKDPDSLRISAFYLGASFLHLKNFDIVGVPVRISGHTQSECISARKGSNCIIENISMHDGMAIGYYQTAGSNNLVLNCDAYNNWDYFSEGVYGGNVDGFGGHVTHDTDTGNVFRGCRAWRNSDDGFDLISAYAAFEFDSCMAFYNGYRPIDVEDHTTFTSAGDGNGFKAGGYGMGSNADAPSKIPRHYIHHCMAYKNKANGFYSNHHLGGSTWAYNSAWSNKANYCMVNRKSLSEAVDVPGYGHILHHNLSMVPGANGDLYQCDLTQSTLYNNTWTPDSIIKIIKSNASRYFLSIDVNELTKPRNADGTLSIDFLKAKTATTLAERHIGWLIQTDEEASINDLRSEENQEEDWYTLTGIKCPTQPTQPGIYIRRGKKIFIQ